MSGKRLLKNVLAHTGTLNKMQEEREMWRLRALEKNCRWEDQCTYESRSMLTRGRLLSDSLSSPPSPPSLTGGHQDPSPDDRSTRGERREEQTVGYWTRRLLKQEEKDPSRWGHSGYKEIYAEEFASSESENENNERTGHKKERVKKVKSDVLGSTGTHRRKRKRRDDSSGSSDEERRRRRMKRKKKHDMRKKEKRKRSPPTTDAN